MDEDTEVIPEVTPPSREMLDPSVTETSLLSIDELETIDVFEDGEQDPSIAQVVSTLLGEGTSSNDYKRRAKAAELLAKNFAVEPLSRYADHIARALHDSVNRDLSDNEKIFPEQYADQRYRVGQALTKVIAKLTESSPSDVSQYAPLLLAYLTSEDGEIDHTVVALETLVEWNPSTIPSEQLLDLFNEDDPYVVAAAARLLTHILKEGNRHSLITQIDIRCLESLLDHADSDVSGAAAEVISEIAEAGFEGKIVGEISLSAFESPLLTDSSYCNINATATLCALAAAGFETRIISDLDLGVLNEPLKISNPDIIGNAAIVIGYLADTGTEYGSQVTEQIEYEHLAVLLDHDSSFVAWNATSALGYLAEHDQSGRIARQIDGEHLESLVEHSEPQIAGSAIALLNEIIDAENIDHLTPEFNFEGLAGALSHPNPLPRGNAAATPGFLAEQDRGELIIDSIDLSLLDRCLRVESERVCGGAAGSLADLVEAGYGEKVVTVVDLDVVTALLDRSEAFVCGNAVLLIGHLAASGFADDLDPHIEMLDLAKRLDHSDRDVVKHASLAIAGFAGNGYADAALNISERLHSLLTHSPQPGTKGAIATVCYCCLEAPEAVLAVDDGLLFDTVLSVSNRISLAYEMEIDSQGRVLRTLVATACLSMANSEPHFMAERTQEIRSLLRTEPYLEQADQGLATTYLLKALTVVPATATLETVQ